ncbi:hypothetical protein [Paracoccus sp. IB05]|uniref:hypothetical protein n=1 Tax=Paracoccus sp. IB05 TaxID=2779367 RepID=UPI0018E7DCAD|nr:hypothetical protein [Paracoccus sp. IB05]MBJ2150784.1 hypothetical protein [Paracoccus sp. IB05]
MPKLVRLYIQSVAIGFGLSAGFVAAMLWTNVAAVGALIGGAGAMGWVAVAMLVMFFGVLFSGVQFAIRVMMLAEQDDTPRGGLRQQMIPIRIEARAEQQKRQPRR